MYPAYRGVCIRIIDSELLIGVFSIETWGFRIYDTCANCYPVLIWIVALRDSPISRPHFLVPFSTLLSAHVTPMAYRSSSTGFPKVTRYEFRAGIMRVINNSRIEYS